MWCDTSKTTELHNYTIIRRLRHESSGRQPSGVDEHVPSSLPPQLMFSILKFLTLQSVLFSSLNEHYQFIDTRLRQSPRVNDHDWSIDTRMKIPWRWTSGQVEKVR